MGRDSVHQDGSLSGSRHAPPWSNISFNSKRRSFGHAAEGWLQAVLKWEDGLCFQNTSPTRTVPRSAPSVCETSRAARYPLDCWRFGSRFTTGLPAFLLYFANLKDGLDAQKAYTDLLRENTE
ncbi:hypothetical protein TrVFT333_009714 [Trichoderma virens FT-333]|nr:hypothetical protein TrVFT333_009714 [Trichoderma virens FT-333]